WDHILALQPDDHGARLGRAGALTGLGRQTEAIEIYDAVLRDNPDDAVALAERLVAAPAINQWAHWSDDRARFAAVTESGAVPPAPFFMLSVYDDPTLHRVAATRYLNHRCKASMSTAAPTSYAGHDRIRLGYFSADFHNHATMHLIAELLEQHDRDR